MITVFEPPHSITMHNTKTLSNPVNYDVLIYFR